MHQLPKNLIFLRRKFAVTQVQLASWLKKGQTTIGGWENGVAEPGIDSLIKISEIFGIYIDDLIRADIEKGNLITEEEVSKFKKEGNRIGNRIGNRNKLFQLGQSENLAGNDSDPVRDWALINLLKGMDAKIDQVIISLGKNEKKGS